MIFNYKRLNDNNKDENYLLLNKEALINKIKNNFIFSKLDLKSKFFQAPWAK